MMKEEIRTAVDTMTSINGKYMMGTKAYHQLGEISSDEYDIFYCENESNDYWIGSWVTGFGFFNVCFPKSTSRELTADEISYYKTLNYQINSQPSQKLNIN